MQRKLKVQEGDHDPVHLEQEGACTWRLADGPLMLTLHLIKKNFLEPLQFSKS